jgi:hypothetical protein
MSYLNQINNIVNKTGWIEEQTKQNMREIRDFAYQLARQLSIAKEQISALEEALEEYGNDDLWNEYSVEDMGDYRTVFAFDLCVPDPTYTAKKALAILRKAE